MSITLHGTMRPADEPEGETRQLEATGDTYEAAHASLTAQVPDGWRLLGIARWPA